MVKVKDRRTRTRIVGSEPIPLSEMKGSAGDQSVEERVDGISGRGDATRVRKRTGSTEPLPMSTMEMLEAVVSLEEFWLEAGRIQARLGSCRRGRPRKSSVAALMLFEMFAWELKTSLRGAGRELADVQQWDRLRRASEAAYPDHPERRLPTDPPNLPQTRTPPAQQHHPTQGDPMSWFISNPISAEDSDTPQGGQVLTRPRRSTNRTACPS